MDTPIISADSRRVETDERRLWWELRLSWEVRFAGGALTFAGDSGWGFVAIDGIDRDKDTDEFLECERRWPWLRR